jgi:hypothetical protein
LLHQKAAALHAADDGRGSRCLELAGSLQYANGERRAARAAMEAAADRALARGDVMQAADAYVKASIIAFELRDGAGGAALARRARRLADSPLLSADQRAAITARIVARR